MAQNYIGKIIAKHGFSFKNEREVGSEIYIHIDDVGQVFLFSPADFKKKLPVYDLLCNNIEEAKKYATCIKKTNFDVKAAWDKMMSDRYW